MLFGSSSKINLEARIDICKLRKARHKKGAKG